MWEPEEVDFAQARVLGSGDNAILVFKRCPKCGRYIRFGPEACVIVTQEGDVVRFEGFECSRCGTIEPCWIRTP